MGHLKAQSGRRSRATKEMTRPCRKYRIWHLFGCASCMRCRDGATPSILPACHLWTLPPTHLLASLTATTRFTGNPVLPVPHLFGCAHNSRRRPCRSRRPSYTLHRTGCSGLQRTTTDSCVSFHALPSGRVAWPSLNCSALSHTGSLLIAAHRTAISRTIDRTHTACRPTTPPLP